MASSSNSEPMNEGSSGSTVNRPETVQRSSTRPELPCKVCNIIGRHGQHYGAPTICRSCAAFFRRCAYRKEKDVCRYRTNKCGINVKNLMFCRACRLKKCVQCGMKRTLIQEDRDPMSSTVSRDGEVRQRRSITKISELYDVEKLKAEIRRIFAESDEHFLCPRASSLQIMEYGLKYIRRDQKRCLLDVAKTMRFDKLTEARCGLIRKAAQWSMFSSEFRSLSENEKIMIVTMTWDVWARLERLTMTVELFGERTVTDRIVFTSNTDSIYLWDVVQRNLSHIEQQELNEVNREMSPLFDVIFNNLARKLVDLKPDLMETAYMLCELVWIVSGRTLKNESLENMERFMATIENDLHNHYNSLRNENYAARILAMSTIVTRIQKTYIDIHKAMRRAEGYLMEGFNNVLSEDDDDE